MNYQDFYGSRFGAPPAQQQGAIAQQLQALMGRVAALEKNVALLMQDASRKSAFVKDALASFRGINESMQAIATMVAPSPSDQRPRASGTFTSRPSPAGFLPAPFPSGSGFPAEPDDGTGHSDLSSDDTDSDTTDDDF